jgi:hypothetical protein
MQKRRIETLERISAAATARWIQSLSDEELEELAGEIGPEEQAFLESLTTKQLEDLRDGRMSLGEYREMRESWERTWKNASRSENTAGHDTTSSPERAPSSCHSFPLTS